MELVDSGCRRSCATTATCPACASTWPTPARGVDEEETCAARVYKDAADMLDERAGASRSHGRRLLRPARALEPAEQVHRHVLRPRVRRAGDRRHPLRLRRNFTGSSSAACTPSTPAEVTMTDHWLGHFMDRFYELGLDENTVIVLLSDHGYLLGERGYTGKVPSQLHPELAQVPLIVVHPEGQGGRRGDPLFRLDPRRRAHGPLDGRHRPARTGWRAPTCPAAGRRAAARDARVPLRRDVQPLLHPHRRLGA